jgi:kynureninase
LYTRFVDVWDAVAILQDILDNQQYNLSEQRVAVT